MKEAAKHDGGKLRYDLIPASSLAELARVYTFGAQKYGERNWERGVKFSRVFGAIMRHMWAWWAGEDTDRESGISHLAHAAWGCFALLAYVGRGSGTDDREERNLPCRKISGGYQTVQPGRRENQDGVVPEVRERRLP